MRRPHASWLERALLVVAFVVLGAGAQAETVRMWVYHAFPPFVVDMQAQSGLSFDLAEMLTEHAQGTYQFEVYVLPRQRLNMELRNDAPGIVLWSNPAWFGDADRTRFLWTGPVLSDWNDVLSPARVPFHYTGPASLEGRAFVGVKGHRYVGLEDQVAEGRTERVDLGSEAAVVQFIAIERGAVGIVAHAAARYFVDTLGLEDQVFFSPTPHARYERSILVHSSLPAVHRFLDNTLQKMADNGSWAALLASYGLEPETHR